jgi:hypothetical protein
MVEYLLAPLFATLITEEAPHARFLVHGFDDSNYRVQLASQALDIAVSVLDSPAPGMHSRKISVSGARSRQGCMDSNIASCSQRVTRRSVPRALLFQ